MSVSSPPKQPNILPDAFERLMRRLRMINMEPGRWSNGALACESSNLIFNMRCSRFCAQSAVDAKVDRSGLYVKSVTYMK